MTLIIDFRKILQVILFRISKCGILYAKIILQKTTYKINKLKMFLSNKKNILLFTILFIFIGIFLRVYQLNFENYWLDEMISFWVADPSLSLDDTFSRRDQIEQSPILFDLILKQYLEFFNYDPEIARH